MSPITPRAPRDFRAVIFDMDGVVVNSEPYHERAFLEVMREIGYGENHGMRFGDYIGLSDHLLWVDFVAKHRPPQTYEELKERKLRCVVEMLRRDQPVFEGAVKLAEQLAVRYPIALASGSLPGVIQAVLDLRNLRRLFRVVVSASEVTHGKPAPDIFLLAAKKLGIRPADCWVIEDSKPGVAAALAAGMRVIAIPNTHSAAELGQATCVMETYEAIGQLLLGVA